MIALNDFRRRWAEISADVLAAAEEVGVGGHYVLGPSVQGFEHSLASFCGVREAVGVGNGLDALEICLRATGCGPGDRVLTTPLSAFATTLAILRVGAIPCFVDVEEDGLLNLDLAERVLQARRDVRFLVPVHLYGRSLPIGRLRALRDLTGVTVIEDCAQAIGAGSEAGKVGSVGRASALSFYPTKNLGCLGDGGAILTSEEGVASSARALRDYGQSARYVHDVVGLNSRLDELQAHLLDRVFLPRLNAWTQRRREIAATYLRSISNKRLRMTAKPILESVWHLFPLMVEHGSRSDLERHLLQRGIQTGVHYPRLIPDQAACRSRCELLSDLVLARKVADSELSLPIHPQMSDEEVRVVVTACNDWTPS